MINIEKIMKDFIAALYGEDFEKINEILDKAIIANNREYDNVIHVERDYAFAIAVLNGHRNVIDKLLALTPDPAIRETMIHSGNDSPFAIAALNGHIEVMDKLLVLTPNFDKREAMIHADDDYAFKLTAKNGRIDCFIYLCSLIDVGEIDKVVKKSLNDVLENINIFNIQSSKQNLMLTYLNDLEGIKSLVSIYNLLIKEHNWPISKLKPIRIFVNEISNFMRVSKNPFNNMRAHDESEPDEFVNFAKNRDILINILYQDSSVKDKLSFQEAVRIIETMEETRIKTLASANNNAKPNIVKAHTSFVEKLKGRLPTVTCR
ncbi:MAG: hypothetical protein ACK4OM_05180 [Alphaproteobacteria bacterium]